MLYRSVVEQSLQSVYEQYDVDIEVVAHCLDDHASTKSSKHLEFLRDNNGIVYVCGIHVLCAFVREFVCSVPLFGRFESHARFRNGTCQLFKITEGCTTWKVKIKGCSTLL